MISLILAWSACGETQTQETGPQSHKGIDVSHYNGSVDWQKVKAAGYSFGIAKASEGMDFTDPMFTANWSNMKAAGIARGAYHFYVTEDDPKKQAEFFISIVSLQTGDLIPVVDIETLGQGTESRLTDRFKQFLDILQKHYGVKPIIYTDRNFWDTNLNDQFGSYPLWIAEYGVEKPELPNGWKNWTLWQWSQDTQVPGVDSGVDQDKLNPGIDISSLQIKSK